MGLSADKDHAVFGAAAAIVVAGMAAYFSSFSGSFVFLDQSAIVNNPTIRHLGDIGRVLHPPSLGGLTVGGRPLLNLTLALNYAAGGLRVGGYHAVNLAIHILAGLTLFGLLRRTLQSLGLAFAAALLWTVHPLQTESVTYVIQRAESLMGLFYLLTLYCFVRGTEGRRGFYGLSVAACLLGMATKEVMASAPVIVFLYDWAFVAGSAPAAWSARKGYYLALAATLVLLGVDLAGTGGSRGGTSGFGLSVSWGAYVLTQGPAILHYLRLAAWPHPLVFYSTPRWVHDGGAWIESAVVAAAALASVWVFLRPPSGLPRGRALGFAGLFFFAILAPTSLVPGMSQTRAEHRMYLALAPVLAVAVTALASALHRKWPRAATAVLLGTVLLVATAFGALTAERNLDYRNEVALWSSSIAHEPDNPYAQNNLGIALVQADRPSEAVAHFEAAIRYDPDYAEAYDNLGLVLAGEGRLTEAVAQYERALARKRRYPEALTNCGVALAGLGRWDEAIDHFREAARIDPQYPAARGNLAAALAATGRLPEAIVEYGRALALSPDNGELHFNYANALAHLGRWEEARTQYEATLRLRPDYPEASANLGVALAQTGRLDLAVAQYRRALALSPDDADVRYNLALAERALGLEREAAADFAAADRLRGGRQP